MAEIILKNKLKLAGLTDVRVMSAGLCADEGQKISKNSQLALKRLGLKSYSFKSRPLTQEIMEKTDIVICMTASHKAQLSGFNNVLTMNEITGLGDIIDPYGGDINVYVETMYQIDDACNIILTKIFEQKGE
jgi:protein-tyrosine phosphatase